MNGLIVSMKKILLVGSNSIHCKRYIDGLLTHNLTVEIITNQVMDEFLKLKQTTVNFALHNLKASKQILSVINDFKPDVIHIHQANSYAWHTLRAVAKIKPRPKVILTAWGSDVLVSPNKSKLLKKIVRYNLVNSDIITSDSLFMSAKIAELISSHKAKIHTINFGIQELPIKQNIESKQKVILSNRLHKPLYRIDYIVRAFIKLCQSNLINSDYKLVVAAGGEQTQHLIDMVTNSNCQDRVIFTGMIPYLELVNYYRQASIFVSVPESDGTASSLLESMAYGCIPVLSNLPANLEWVLDGVNGFIVPDVNNLELHLLKALKVSQSQIDYQQLYDFNYKMIATKATFQENIKKFIELYS